MDITVSLAIIQQSPAIPTETRSTVMSASCDLGQRLVIIITHIDKKLKRIGHGG